MKRIKKIVTSGMVFVMMLSLLLTGSVQGLALNSVDNLGNEGLSLIASIEDYIEELWVEMAELNADGTLVEIDVELDGNGEVYAITYTFDLSDEAEAESQRQLNEQLEKIGLVGNPRMRTGISSRKVLNRTSLASTGYRRAGNQPAAGTRLVNGGSLGWSAGSSPSVSLSFSVGWKAGSVSVGLGSLASGGGVVTVSVPVPANVFMVVEVNTTMQAREYRIYTRQAGMPAGVYQFNTTVTTSVLHQRSVRAVRA